MKSPKPKLRMVQKVANRARLGIQNASSRNPISRFNRQATTYAVKKALAAIGSKRISFRKRPDSLKREPQARNVTKNDQAILLNRRVHQLMQKVIMRQEKWSRVELVLKEAGYSRELIQQFKQVLVSTLQSFKKEL